MINTLQESMANQTILLMDGMKYEKARGVRTAASNDVILLRLTY